MTGALPMLAIAASALWSGRTAKSQWQPFTVAHGSVNEGQLSGHPHEVLNVGYVSDF